MKKEYMSVKEAAEKWKISDRRVRILCETEKIAGVIKEGNSYKIPYDSMKPMDGRRQKGKVIAKEYQELFSRIESKKEELSRRRPLTQGELKRLQEEFLLEFIYNSNAIEGNTLTLQETAMVLDGITIDKKPLKDHLEAVGHKEAFEYVKELIDQKENFSEKMHQYVEEMVNGTVVELNPVPLQRMISGNVDSEQIKKICFEYGIKILKECSELDMVKRKRNELAHGESRFSEVGGDITESELQKYKAAVYAHLDLVIKNTEKFLKNQEYKKL